MITISIRELDPPSLQFGGAGEHSDPKVGLEHSGPFDIRFGAARQNQVRVGVIGPKEIVDDTLRWLERCQGYIPTFDQPSLLRRPYPGFSSLFRSSLTVSDDWCIRFPENANSVSKILDEPNLFKRFQAVVDLYGTAHARLASRDANRPDVIILALSNDILAKSSTVERDISYEEKAHAKAVLKARSSPQLDFFDLLHEVEQTEEDLLKRDLRHALKARALTNRLPIQIVTPSLVIDGTSNQDPATRAWNFTVALYYKAGGVPWRLPSGAPETCFVGISFHHFHTSQRHIVQSTLAQAFSSEGEGFAIRGQSVPATPRQRLNVHLTEEQSFNLGSGILSEYQSRTGGRPIRLVIHKTSHFNNEERAGFEKALREVPIVELVTLVPSNFRLLRFGVYPPKVGTLCTVNEARDYLFTSGFMPELGTYPGPHVPQPFEVRRLGDGSAVSAAQDVLNLTRMNWNTADIRGKWPVSLSFARRIGGILDEYSFGSDEEEKATSFRYFL